MGLSGFKELELLLDDAAAVQTVDEPTTIWLSVDMGMLLRTLGAKRPEAAAIAKALIESMLERFGPEATILVSAFNFEFPRSKIFDALESRVETGAFGQLLLSSSWTARLVQPFYSFFVFGRRQAALPPWGFSHSTGKDSVFEWILKEPTKLLALGHHYNKSFSFIHHAEDLVGVSYRYRKDFHGRLVRGDQHREQSVSFLVRELSSCDGSVLTLAGDACLRRESIVTSSLVRYGSQAMVLYQADVPSIMQVLIEDLMTESPKYSDYYGPLRPPSSIILESVADRLYLDEWRRLRAASI